MVGHLLEYHRACASSGRSPLPGELGEVRYIYTNRLNLGQLRADENALWSLGAHDVSSPRACRRGALELDARGEAICAPVSRIVVSRTCASHRHHCPPAPVLLDPHKERA